MSKKSVILPNDRENISELTITILGNANSGKSSLVGILTNPSFSKIADDLIEISKKDENISNILKNFKDYFKGNFSYLNNEIINNWTNNL